MNIFSDDKKYLELTHNIWRFLCPSTPTETLKAVKADAIFVFGGIGLEIPEQAAYLYQKNICDTILVTGKSGAATSKYFNEDEHFVFYKHLLNKDVLEKDIVLEKEATNAGQNVTFGMKKLSQIKDVTSLIIVCRSFMMLRALATFKKQFPHIVCYPSLPKGNVISISQIPRVRMAKRLLGELERLEKYHDQGFISLVEIPKYVRNDAEKLQRIIAGIEANTNEQQK